MNDYLYNMNSEENSMKITSLNISFYPTSRISLTIHKTTLTVEYSV